MSQQYKYILSFVFVLLWTVESVAGGFIIIDNNKKAKCASCSNLQEYTITPQSETVEVRIKNQQATTQIQQAFYNSFNRKTQGSFYFPIPHQKAVQDLTFTLNGKSMKAEKLDEATVLQLQKDHIQKHLDPSLLQVYGQDLYQINLGEIEPRSKKQITISYKENLLKNSNITAYDYPFHLQKKQTALENISFKVSIFSDESIKDIYSPTFNIASARTNEHEAIVEFEEQNYQLNRDFKLFYSTDSNDIGTTLITHKETTEEEGYFYLNLTPAIEIEHLEILEKDITFVLDCSGSMVGEKMEQAKKALLFCVKNLNENDRFNIVRFSTEAEALFDELEGFNEGNLTQALAYIKALKATGGTNIDEALDLALDVEKSHERPYMVVFITDGKPTIGVTKELPLIESVQRNNKNNAKIFTFGIGDDLNARLLDRINETTKAYGTYIGTDENIEIKITNFYNKVSSPILTDVTLAFEGVNASKIYPQDLPDLSKGNALMVFGKYQKGGNAKAVLKGKMNGVEQQFDFDLNFEDINAENNFIESLWSTRQVGYLLNEIRSNGEYEDTKQEIVHLSQKHGIITPYTTHLILQQEAQKESENAEIPSLNSINLQVLDKEQLLKKVAQMEYDNMLNKRTGAESVQASREVNALCQASNESQMTQGQNRLNYAEHKGKFQNIQDRIQTIQDQVFFNNKDTWSATYLDLNPIETKKIQFNSSAYFELLQNDPAIAPYLSLGRSIQFTHNQVHYHIHE